MGVERKCCSVAVRAATILIRICDKFALRVHFFSLYRDLEKRSLMKSIICGAMPSRSGIH